MDASGGGVAAFADRLRRLRAEAGSPTYREMARSAMYSASVLSSAANGQRLPTLTVALAYVSACGGDRNEWRRRWLEVAGDAASVAAPRRTAGVRERPDDPAPALAPAPTASASVLPQPRQLPPRPHKLVGRKAELERLAGTAAGLVVISGPVGVGKSELALYHAHRMAAGMVDGQLYADLGPVTDGGYDAVCLIGELLKALGVPPERMPGSPEQRAGLYRSLLAQRRVLVLVDNVHAERQVRPLMVDSATSLTLAVSRSPLLGLRDVHRVQLEPLPRADSLTLIAQGLPERAHADPVSADRLADLCGDLPLALDIAARKLLAHPEMSLRWAVGRLHHPGTLLRWLSVGDLSLREALAAAHQRLSAPAAELLGRLAAAPHPELRAHESVLTGADQLIDELVEAGMLRSTARFGVYRLDPLARAFVEDAGTPRRLAPRHAEPRPRPQPQGSGPARGPADEQLQIIAG